MFVLGMQPVFHCRINQIKSLHVLTKVNELGGKAYFGNTKNETIVVLLNFPDSTLYMYIPVSVPSFENLYDFVRHMMKLHLRTRIFLSNKGNVRHV